MRFGVLPGSAQLYVVSICALAALLAALAASQPAIQAPLELFAMLGLAAAVAHSFPVSAPGKQAYHVSLPFVVAAIILLAPVQLVALVVCVHLAEWLRRRRSVTAQLFNTAAFAIAGLIAQAAYRWLWPASGDLTADLRQPAFLVAGLVGAIIFALLTRCLVSVAIWLGNRIAPPNQRLFDAEGLLTDGILLLMGVPLAHLAVIAPWAAAIGAAPLWLIHRVLDLPNLRSQSRQDGLTELFTAPYLTESCTHELNRARRFGRPLSLLLLDLDGLSQLNAAHGTQAGDAALRSTARAITRTIREYDLPARLTGGLFAVLLPETDLAQAREVAERVRRAVAERRHEIPNSVEQTQLTLSIGGTALADGNASAAQLLETAQAALARAKHDGGNQIKFAALQAAPSSVAELCGHPTLAFQSVGQAGPRVGERGKSVGESGNGRGEPGNAEGGESGNAGGESNLSLAEAPESASPAPHRSGTFLASLFSRIGGSRAAVGESGTGRGGESGTAGGESGDAGGESGNAGGESNPLLAEAPASAFPAPGRTGTFLASLFLRIGGSRAAAAEADHSTVGVGRLWSAAHGLAARLVLGGLAALLLVIGAVLSTPTLDWRLLAVLTSAAVLAGLLFCFKSLSVALALAIEPHRSPARLWLVLYWRLWPLYLALGATGLLVAYAYSKFGFMGAIGVAAAALLFRQLAGQYVDRTLEGVRTLRTANEQLEHQAFHDPLTSLANRTLFAERLERAMVRSVEGSVAVLFLDLDNFKAVNDTLGHGVGDALLLAATGRLLECVRREDTIARLGGDEFTVLLEDMHDPSDAVRMADRIGDALRTPFELAGQQVVISASIGIALDTDRSHKPDDLLREADIAMYRAKSGGKARYEIFDTGLGTRAMERLELETELRHAAERGQLVLHYQPIVDLGTGSIDAVEALLRWQHPRRGLLEPFEFMAVAEQTGIVLDLGHWTLHQACRHAAAWQIERPGLVIQVNLSPLEVQRASVVELVAHALAASGLAPRCLRLEVPESAVARNGEVMTGVLDDLQSLGVRIALDDVGDGVSSLAWLSRSPVDMLKIGSSATDSPALVRASVALGAALGMTVTAQGVDGADQAVRLAALGCRHAQGDLYGAPQTAESIAEPLGASMAARAA